MKNMGILISPSLKVQENYIIYFNRFQSVESDVHGTPLYPTVSRAAAAILANFLSPDFMAVRRNTAGAVGLQTLA